MDTGAVRLIASTAADGQRDSGIRLAELVAAFSLATDLGLGLPMEHALRSSLIASRLGARMGLGNEAPASQYYLVTLAWVGCVADTPDVAHWFGDDIAFRRDSFGPRSVHLTCRREPFGSF